MVHVAHLRRRALTTTGRSTVTTVGEGAFPHGWATVCRLMAQAGQPWNDERLGSACAVGKRDKRKRRQISYQRGIGVLGFARGAGLENSSSIIVRLLQLVDIVRHTVVVVFTKWTQVRGRMKEERRGRRPKIVYRRRENRKKRRTLNANFEISTSEHRSRHGAVGSPLSTQTDPSGERQRAPSTRVLRRVTTSHPVLGDYHAQEEPGSDDSESGDRPW